MELFTWDYLSTAAGATAATALFTQFIKNLSFLEKLNNQLISYVVAVVVMFSSSFFTNTLTVSNAVLVFFNAVIVMLAANGAYNTLSKKTNKLTTSNE